MLLASGDVRIVRVWDAHREMKVQVRYFFKIVWGIIISSGKASNRCCEIFPDENSLVMSSDEYFRIEFWLQSIIFTKQICIHQFGVLIFREKSNVL